MPHNNVALLKEQVITHKLVSYWRIGHDAQECVLLCITHALFLTGATFGLTFASGWCTKGTCPTNYWRKPSTTSHQVSSAQREVSLMYIHCV